MQISDPRHEARMAAELLGLHFGKVYRELSDRSAGFVYVPRKASPARGARLEAEPDGLHIPVGREARLSAGNGRRAGARLRGHRQHRPRRARARAEQGARGKPGRETVVRDALGQAVNTVNSVRRTTAADVFLTLDSHIQANAEQVLERTVQQWHARPRRRSCWTRNGRDPRDGAGARLRRERYPAATRHDLRRPRGERRLRAGLGLQGRDRRRRTVGARDHAADEVHAAVLDSCRDRVVHDAEISADRADDASRRSSSARRTSARSPSPRGISAKLGLKKWMARFGFGRFTGIDLPGETTGSCCRRTVVRIDDRQRPDRPGCGRSPASSSRPRTPRSRTAESGSSRTSSTTSSAGPAAAPIRRRTLARSTVS